MKYIQATKVAYILPIPKIQKKKKEEKEGRKKGKRERGQEGGKKERSKEGKEGEIHHYDNE